MALKRIRIQAEYDANYAESVKDPVGFWTAEADTFEWHQKWNTALEWDFETPNVKWFAGGKLSRSEWREFAMASPGMHQFRQVMFSRLVPNLREIGLMTDRILPRYDEVGLMQYFGGRAADKITAAEMLSDAA